MSDASSTRRPWFRFGLRTLLIALTVAAIASWGYWGGWSRWRMYCDQLKLEAAARQIQRGWLMSDEWEPDVVWYSPPRVGGGGRWNEKGKFTRTMTYGWPNALYVVFCRFHRSHCWSVEVFRLPAAPQDYQPQTDRSRRDLAQLEFLAQNIRQLSPEHRAAIGSKEERKAQAYTIDFIEMISGDRRDKLGFQYELIRADLPMDNAWQEPPSN